MTAVTIAKVARQTLHGEVTSRLRDLIVQGHFGPGQRINEVRLGQDLGVSRTPLREAIRTLSSEGLLELVPNHGAIVRSFSMREVMDMIETLSIIEQGCAELGCERATEAEIDRFRTLHSEMVENYKARERLSYFQHNQQLHEMLVGFAKNETLTRIHGDIQSRLKRIRFLGNDEPTVWAKAIEEHGAMAEALASRDSDALVAVLRSHKKLTMDRIRSIAAGESL
jgi:DNA-binding GntR family transcriptional regulator